MQKNWTLPKGTSRCRFNTMIESIHGKSFWGNNGCDAVACHHKPQWMVTVAVGTGNVEDCNHERHPADLEQKVVLFGQMIINFYSFPFEILMFQTFRIVQTSGIFPVYFQHFLWFLLLPVLLI
jgi:hypothetical protein